MLSIYSVFSSLKQHLLSLIKKTKGLVARPFITSLKAKTIREGLAHLLHKRRKTIHKKTMLDKDDFSDEEIEMLNNLVEFSSLRLVDIMVPRADILCLDQELDLTRATTLFTQSGHSRMPIYRDDFDNPTGFVHIKDLFLASQHTRPIKKIKELKRQLLFAPPSMAALELLLRMRVRQIHICLVVDEYGGITGLVTIEDLVEKIVGDISDEHDTKKHQIFTQADGVIDAQARMEIKELEGCLGVSLDAGEDIDTIGGLVFALAGRVPQRGEVLTHKAGVEFEITDADERRIKSLRMRAVKTKS